jgi:transcriptional regulator with XRE-family HTH domain
MADTNQVFTAWLKSTRTAAGLSQQKVADALKAQGFTVFQQTTVAKIERGERPVRLDEAVAFAGLFGATLDVALGLKPDDSQSFTSRDLARRTSLLQQISSLVEAELGGAQ